MSSGGNTSVNSVCAHCKHYDKGKQQQHKKSTPNNLCGNCTKQHTPGQANCPARESVCNKCEHIGYWKPKCRGGAPPQKLSGKKQHPGKGKKKTQGKNGHTGLVDVDDYDGQYNEIDIHFINVKPDLSFTDDPDDVAKSRKTEAYTIVHLPTSCEDKTDASVHVKVDTGAGGNVMPLKVFERLYPNQINMKGKPTGLEPSSTCPTAYNGTPIPQYGALRCPLIWRPGNGVRPRWI